MEETLRCAQNDNIIDSRLRGNDKLVLGDAYYMCRRRAGDG
jgi:hypothetical protein